MEKVKSLQEKNKLLADQLAAAQKALEQERMKNRSLEVLLEIAEEDHNLKLKKMEKSS